MYVSESFGSILGSQVMALDPQLPAAVLDVGGGGFLSIWRQRSARFAHAVAPSSPARSIRSVDVNPPDTLPTHAQMSLNLLQTVIEPGDGLALATAAPAGKHVLFLEAFSDETVPNPATEALASPWGVTQVMLAHQSTATRVVTLPQAAAPYAATPLRALVQLDPAAHPMITQQDGERVYQVGFPPFVKLPTPQKFDNPIEVVHALAVGFAETFRTTGTPSSSDPTQ